MHRNVIKLLIKKVKRLLKGKKYYSETLTKREVKQMLKILNKWAPKDGADIDGDTVTVAFNLLQNKVELCGRFDHY